MLSLARAAATLTLAALRRFGPIGPKPSHQPAGIDAECARIGEGGLGRADSVLAVLMRHVSGRAPTETLRRIAGAFEARRLARRAEPRGLIGFGADLLVDSHDGRPLRNTLHVDRLHVACKYRTNQEHVRGGGGGGGDGSQNPQEE